ncbi:hypothetical protein D7207_27725 [Burkholderia cepacia]|nr:hypothetical protein [Burkholderia cepacia]QDS28141.1 transposase [Burkholderia contaminans]MBA9977440.1 hypothetical protein [Burkholderia cepacia]MBA9996194.1 hypothetical protein [Burkholderia cepacia]MBB0004027.1 hypothetical protein [Burkholderia cepacia]
MAELSAPSFQHCDGRLYGPVLAVSPIWTCKPLENGYIECLSGRFPDECLNEHWFVSMRHARSLIELW